MAVERAAIEIQWSACLLAKAPTLASSGKRAKRGRKPMRISTLLTWECSSKGKIHRCLLQTMRLSLKTWGSCCPSSSEDIPLRSKLSTTTVRCCTNSLNNCLREVGLRWGSPRRPGQWKWKMPTVGDRNRWIWIWIGRVLKVRNSMAWSWKSNKTNQNLRNVVRGLRLA